MTSVSRSNDHNIDFDNFKESLQTDTNSRRQHLWVFRMGGLVGDPTFDPHIAKARIQTRK